MVNFYFPVQYGFQNMVDFSDMKQLADSTLVLFKDHDISEPLGWEKYGMIMFFFC